MAFPGWMLGLRQAPRHREEVLTRWAHTDYGVLGRLGKWHTLENPWRDNAPRVSCIPSGRYRCKRDYYHKGGYVAFYVTEVPDRSRILIHIGNKARDTMGCPLLGTQLGVLGGQLAVVESGKAYKEWMRYLEGVDEFYLTIRDIDGRS